MTKERVDRAATASCATRSAAAARAARSSSSRSPTPTPASTRASRRPARSPDAWSSAMQYVNYQLLRRYFENPSRWAPGVVVDAGRDRARSRATRTRPTRSRSPRSSRRAATRARAAPACPPEQVYDAKTNPKGVRCSFQDYMVNVFGRRPQDGFAGRPLGNIGIEYGRKALARGQDHARPVRRRQREDRVVRHRLQPDRRAHRRRPARRSSASTAAARSTPAENLDQVAIIDLRGPDPGAFHDVYRTYAMRARLEREHGTAANQVLWRGQVAAVRRRDFVDEAIVAMDEWLAAVEKDPRDVPLARKILEDKPKTLDRPLHRRQRAATSRRRCATRRCRRTPTRRSRPACRSTDDTMRCDAQAAAPRGLRAGRRSPTRSGQQLQKTFPNGVCDFTKPGEDRVHDDDVADLPGRGRQASIYGGRALGAVPAAEPLNALGLPSTRRCVSRRSFRLRLRAPRGQRLRSARVYVNGRRVAVRRGRRLTAPVNLRGLPRGTVKVRVVATTRAGRRVVAQRRYRTCATKRSAAAASPPGRR